MAVMRKPVRSIRVDLGLLQREVNQLFQRLSEFDRVAPASETEWVPPVDVYECRGCLKVVMEVPGVPPESLRVTLRERHLTLAGERRERKPAGSVAGFLCMERPQGRFARTVVLDVPIDVREAEARIVNGLLTVSFPTVKDRRGRETVIPIQREDES